MVKEAVGEFLGNYKSIPAFLTKALALTAVSVVSTAVSVEASAPNVHPASVAGDLRPLADLPGFDKRVRAGQFKILEDSMVKVYANTTDEKGTDHSINCSGNKISYRGGDYVVSAAHCFSGNPDSYKSGLLGARQGNEKALDFIKNFKNVEIRDVNQPTAGQSGNDSKIVYELPGPMAMASGVSLGLRGGDDALINVTPVNEGSPSSDDIPTRSFDQVSGLVYRPALNQPLSGQQVAIYGAPSPRNVGVKGIGRYLGRMNLSPFRKQTLDMVAVKAPNIIRDPCEPGASGSAAMTADGHLLGALSFGVQIGFNGFFADDGEAYIPGRLNLPPVYRIWDQIEDTLSVDIPYAFNEICMYGVRDKQSLPNLVGGFGLYAFSAQ